MGVFLLANMVGRILTDSNTTERIVDTRTRACQGPIGRSVSGLVRTC